MSGPCFRLRVEEALSSTSDLVRERAAAGEAAGFAVLARRQTAGRGTQGRQWQSPPGNLFLSVLLRPGGSLRDAPQWGLLAAVALADTMLPLLPDPGLLRLKWPNDVMLEGAKSAGILAELDPDEQGRVGALILGIGVNLAHAPAVPGRRTASLAGLGVTPPSPEAFAWRLLESIGRRAGQYAAEGFGPIRDAWLTLGPERDASLAISRGGADFSGRFVGLAEDGGLLIDRDGRVLTIVAGEVA